MTRRVLPEAPIVYTLHEYLPICLREGQMIRTERKGNELCTHASPRRCNECYPGISTQQFFLREKFIKSHLANVDLFLSPSQFLRKRYIEWGIPAERIRFEELGRRPMARLAEPEEERPRNRLGFFGQLTPFKGAETLLEAMKILAERQPDVHLYLHGAYVEYFAETYGREFLELVGGDERQRHLCRSLRSRRPATPDARHRLGRAPVAVVGELAARRPGGLHARAPRHLQRHRRPGREGAATRSTGCTSSSVTRAASPR